MRPASIRMSALWGACLLASLLTACSPKPPEGAPEATAAPLAEHPAPQAARVVPAVDPNAPPPPCSTGRTKAITNICDDGDPALFRQISADHPLPSPKCVWYTEQLLLAENEALVFRVQDCSAEGWDGEAYAYAGGKVKAGAASTPYAIDRVILEILNVPANQEATRVAIQTVVSAPEAERSRCMIRPVEDAPMAGVTFSVSPNDEFMQELTASGEVWTACGDYGVGGEVQFFEERGGGKLFFHRLGQDLGYWDPASFTFYRLDGSGAWKKSAD